jgi:predicted DNA repair protein MutK
VGVVVTAGVYLLVAAIVKLDDVGLRLQRSSDFRRKLGSGILWVAPRFLKLLTVLGTVAMFVVGGGILSHGIPWLHHFIHGVEINVQSLPHLGEFVGALTPTLLVGFVGLLAGAILTVLAVLVGKMRRTAATTPPH